MKLYPWTEPERSNSVRFVINKLTVIRTLTGLKGIVCLVVVCFVWLSIVCFGRGKDSLSRKNDTSRTAPAIACPEASGLTEAARLLHAQGDFDSAQAALIKYQQALLCWRSADAHREAAETLRSIGDIYYETGQHQTARDSYSEALAESQKIADVRGQAWSLVSIGLVDLDLDQVSDSLAKTHEADRLVQDLHDEAIKVQILNNYVIGLCWRGGRGDLARAATYSDQAVALAEKINDPEILSRTIFFAGAVRNESGKLSEALDYYQRALSLFQKGAHPAWQSRALSAIGQIYVATGEPQKALNYDEDALVLQKQLGDRRTQAVTFNNIGYAFGELGDLEHALENYLSALDCYRELGHAHGEAQTRIFIGDVYRVRGDLEQARGEYQVSQTILKNLPDNVLNALSLTSVGLLSQAEGELSAAISSYGQALTAYDGLDHLRDQVATQNRLGHALSLSGQRDAALRQLSSALSLVEKTGDRKLEVLVRYNLAQVRSSMGQLADARSQVETSLQLIESQRLKLDGFELRSSYFATVRQFYELYADVLMQQHRSHPDDGLDALAFEVSERARARSLLESLKESEISRRTDADADLVEKKRAVQRQLNEASIRRTRLSAETNSVESDAVLKEIDRLTTQYQELEARLRANSAHDAATPPPQPLGLKDSQRLLDSDSLLLEYMLGDERSYLWVVSSAKLESYELPPRSQIESLAAAFRDLLTVNQPVAGETAEQSQARLAQARLEIPQHSKELGKILLGPIADKLGNKRLLIVPDGRLQSIPFQALMLPDSAASARLLVETHEIIYEPSASTLGMVMNGKPAREPGTGSVAIFANPVFEADDPRVKSAEGKSADDAKPQPHLIKQVLRDIGAQETGRIPALPASREEADAIMSAVPWRTGLKAVDFQASRQTIEQTDFSHYRILHFATHGFVDYQHPELSGLVLSMVDEKGQPQDGYLRLHDIYGLKLPVDLVVLSACNSGLGKEIKGEGLIGLTRGFMYAGARGAVVSLWKVDDDATAELMKHFYAGMFQKGLTPAAALREAQLSLRSQRRWNSPYYWAAFVIQGQYDQRDLRTPRQPIFGLTSLVTSFILLSGMAGLVVRWRRRKTVRIK